MSSTAASSHNGIYELNLKPQKSNVFVTQLNEEEDFEDENVRRFPVINGSSDKLLKTGFSSLKKTLFLRKEVEMKLMDDELAAKREEFRKRMAVIKSKEDILKKKREKLSKRINKFDKFLKENEAKKNRALQKYKKEALETKVKCEELTEIQNEVKQLQDKKEKLIKKLQCYKKFEDFMMKIVDSLPENYIEMIEDNMIGSFMRRYEGLTITHKDLIRRNQERSNGIETGHRMLELMRQEKGKRRLLINQELAELQQYLEDLVERSSRLEQQVSDITKKQRVAASGLGRITMAIDNIAISCHNRHWPNLLNMSYTDKLSMIKQYLLYREQVKKLAKDFTDFEAHTSSTNLLSKPSRDSVLSELTRFPPAVSSSNVQPSSTRMADDDLMKPLTAIDENNESG